MNVLTTGRSEEETGVVTVVVGVVGAGVVSTELVDEVDTTTVDDEDSSVVVVAAMEEDDSEVVEGTSEDELETVAEAEDVTEDEEVAEAEDDTLFAFDPASLQTCLKLDSAVEEEPSGHLCCKHCDMAEDSLSHIHAISLRALQVDDDLAISCAQSSKHAGGVATVCETSAESASEIETNESCMFENPTSKKRV